MVVESANDLAIDTTSSQVAGNVTPSEVEDIPVNGRNYVELSALVPGISAKSNSFGNSPGSSGQTSNTGATENGKFQITFDGLQFSQDSVASGFGQPHISQDAISAVSDRDEPVRRHLWALRGYLCQRSIQDRH